MAELNIFDGANFVSAIRDGILDSGNIFFVNSNGKVIRQVEGRFVNNYVRQLNIPWMKI